MPMLSGAPQAAAAAAPLPAASASFPPLEAKAMAARLLGGEAPAPSTRRVTGWDEGSDGFAELGRCGGAGGVGGISGCCSGCGAPGGGGGRLWLGALRAPP